MNPTPSKLDQTNLKILTEDTVGGVISSGEVGVVEEGTKLAEVDCCEGKDEVLMGAALEEVAAGGCEGKGEMGTSAVEGGVHAELGVAGSGPELVGMGCYEGEEVHVMGAVLEEDNGVGLCEGGT